MRRRETNRHDALIVYEFMPFDVNVHDVDAALEVVEGAGAENGGLAIDTWHMSKLEISPDDLRRVPLEYLSWIELSDGQFETMDDPIDEVINHRNLPGEGEFDIRGYIEAAQDDGYAGPWGVEVLSEELRNKPHRRDLQSVLRDDHRSVRHGRGAVVTTPELDADRLVWIYRQMLRIREFEERVKRTFGGFGAASNCGHFGGVANLELWTEWQWHTARDKAEPFPF